MDYSVIDRYIDRLIEDTTPDAPIWNSASAPRVP